MSKVFCVGYFFFVASSLAFIVAILTPFWIIKANPDYRGIFEICQKIDNNPKIRQCSYILTSSDEVFIKSNRFDYAVACASLSIAASSLSIILLLIAGLHMSVKHKVDSNRKLRLRLAEILIAGTLLIDCLTIVVWVVMLAKNLDQNNVITTSQIGWSLWLAVSSTGGFLIALVMFAIHRIDLGAFFSGRNAPYNESREYLQRF